MYLIQKKVHEQLCTEMYLFLKKYRSEVMEISFSMSADVYSDLMIGLAMKNYPKMTLQLPKSIHCI